MKSNAIAWLSLLGLAAGASGARAIAQSSADTSEAHVAAAKAAAGTYHPGLFASLCSASSIQPAPAPQRGQRAGGAAAAAPGPPDRSTWHAEPVKVFDNLYFVGMTEYSAWAVKTSGGIILLDTIYDYSVEDEVVAGLNKLGLDPASIKYALVSHGHADHFGGAKYLQEHFGTKVLMSAADWELIAASRNQNKPARDMVVTDGQKLTLGETTLTFHLTPGHTPGTVSTLIPVTDGGTPHVVAEWGGTGFNFQRTPETFRTYAASAERFRDAAARAGADALISNHTNLDGSKTKLPALALRKPGDPHPYVIGAEAVKGYLTVASECAKAALVSMARQE
jgi:metallo-beta-lactamase class B